MPDQATGLLSPFLRSSRIDAVMPYVLEGRVLDVGCGAGELAAFVAPSRYVGIDPDEAAIGEAKARFPTHTFQAVAEFERHGPTDTFDVIVALAVVEHVADPAEWLGRLRRRLKPGGHFVLTTPHPHFRWLHEIGARLGVFSREAANEHHTFLNRHAMCDLAQHAQLDVFCHGRFLFGANQLVVLRDAGCSCAAVAAPAV